jgi:hypothetical protein
MRTSTRALVRKTIPAISTQQSGHAKIAAATAPELDAALDVVTRVLGRSAISG